VERSDMNYISTVSVGTVFFEAFRIDISLIRTVPDKNSSNVIL
jgi:hypothetical protein